MSQIPSARPTVHHSLLNNPKKIDAIHAAPTQTDARATALGSGLKKITNPKDGMTYYEDEEGGYWYEEVSTRVVTEVAVLSAGGHRGLGGAAP